MPKHPDPTPLIFMGQVYYEMKDYPAAIKQMEAGIDEATQRNVEVRENWWQLLAYLYFEEDRSDDVIRVLENLIREYPKDEYKQRLDKLRNSDNA